MKISCAACVVATIGLLGGSPAYAKGLRGFEVGDPCMAAYEAEIAQGSQPTRPLTEMAADPLASFRGSHDGHAALIGYSCVDGLLTSQLITLKFESESNAVKVLWIH